MSAPAGSAAAPPWRTCLDIEGQAEGHYLDYVNEGLYAGIDGEPGRVLDLGCAAGMFGKTLKERHPAAHVTGIEAGRAAAAKAATRIDRVICARIEQVDFEAQGLGPGAFDLIVAGDVLEHLSNPWSVLARLRPVLAAGGRLVASIPNVRNLKVLAEIALNGRFEYTERGILDITHLRFFAFEDMRTMFEDTGYKLEAFFYTLSPGLHQLYKDHEGQEKVTLRIGRLALADVTQRELMEFCSEQYVVRVRPRT